MIAPQDFQAASLPTMKTLKQDARYRWDILNLQPTLYYWGGGEDYLL